MDSSQQSLAATSTCIKRLAWRLLVAYLLEKHDLQVASSIATYQSGYGSAACSCPNCARWVRGTVLARGQYARPPYLCWTKRRAEGSIQTSAHSHIGHTYTTGNGSGNCHLLCISTGVFWTRQHGSRYKSMDTDCKNVCLTSSRKRHSTQPVRDNVDTFGGGSHA